MILQPVSPAWTATTRTRTINVKCVMKSARLVSMPKPAINVQKAITRRFFPWTKDLPMLFSVRSVPHVQNAAKLVLWNLIAVRPAMEILPWLEASALTSLPYRSF